MIVYSEFFSFHGNPGMATQIPLFLVSRNIEFMVQ